MSTEFSTEIDDRSMGYARTLAKLIQMETVSLVDGYRLERYHEFHGLLRETFPHVFSTCEVEDFSGSLLLRWPGRDAQAQPVLFMNHMDVVETNGTWTQSEPFSGEIKDGKVWGRGTLDTKGGLFCMLQAAEELIEQGYIPACDIYFESSCDEENMAEGCPAIVDALSDRGITFKLCVDEGGFILHDPLGGADGDFAMVGVGEKSLVSLKFIAKSHGGHASMPGKDTPIVRLSRFVQEADKQALSGKLFDVELPDAVAEMLRIMSPTVKGPLGFVFAHSHTFKPLLKMVMPRVSNAAAALMRTTAAFTMSGGSEAFNVLPAEAWVVANMRCSHHQGQHASIQAITQLAKKYDLEVETVERFDESPLSDYRSEGFALMREAITSAYPDVHVSPYVMTAASDSRYLGRVCDTCLRFVPFFISDEQMNGIHGIDENVDISTLAQAVDVYTYLMTNV